MLTPTGPARFRTSEGLDIEAQVIGGEVQNLTAQLSDDVTLVYLPVGR